MKKIFISCQLLLCFILPFAITSSIWMYGSALVHPILLICLLPIVFVLVTIVVCGSLSKLGESAIQNCKIDRILSDPLYFKRRLHAGPWTYIFYFKPLYFLILSIPILKRVCFRMFGYKGNLDFTVYPDTWLRDLPVLNIGIGAYLSNKSSIATNICLMNNTILVEGIRIGDKSCVGHGTLIGPGTVIGHSTELGANITSGIRVRYGSNVKIYEICGIQHGVTIDDGATIEAGTIIGLRSRIGKNIRIKEGSHIHTGTKLNNQKEADQLYSDETGALSRRRVGAMKIVLSDDIVSRSGPSEVAGVKNFTDK